jgi:hypothetical protein
MNIRMAIILIISKNKNVDIPTLGNSQNDAQVGIYLY